jgi:hypothetical protein
VRDDVFHREREEHDAHDHREVQVGVQVTREGDARWAVGLSKELFAADREEVEVREPERCGDE